MPAFWLKLCRQVYRHHQDQLLLGKLLIFSGGSTDAVRALALLVGQVFHVLLGRSVFLFEDGVRLDMLELGLEAIDIVTVGAAIGTTSRVGELVAIVLRLGTRRAPTLCRQHRSCEW